MESIKSVESNQKIIFDFLGQNVDLQMLVKFGCDGSSGHSVFNQVVSQDRCQGALFASTFVVLQLIAYISGKIQILYENTHLASAYGVRPLRFWFVKETEGHAKLEISRLKGEAKNLETFIWAPGISVHFTAFFSMNDMKILNFAWNNRSAMNCVFCGKRPLQFKNPNEFEADPERLEDLCMSVLHYLIRLMEHIFKVIYVVS